jgi:carbamoyl-phosphate synthase large subunit
VIRPSYVLGGRAMEIVRDMAQLERYIAEAVVVSGDSPVLLDSYLDGAVEVDVDALCDGETCMWPASCSISRRPACIRATAPASLPPYSLDRRDRRRARTPDRGAGAALNVVG